MAGVKLVGFASLLTTAIAVVDLAFQQPVETISASNTPERIASGTITGSSFIHAKGAMLLPSSQGGFRGSSSTARQEIGVDNAGVERVASDLESSSSLAEGSKKNAKQADGPRGGVAQNAQNGQNAAKGADAPKKEVEPSPKNPESKPFRLFLDSALIWCILAPFLGVILCILALRPEAVGLATGGWWVGDRELMG